MKKIEIEVSRLLPIDFDKKSMKEINYKAMEIDLGRETSILTIGSVIFPGKFYVGDGHHTVLGYMQLNQNPLITILENDSDLMEVLSCSRHGAINTTHFQIMRERLHCWHIELVNRGVMYFEDLQKMIVNFENLK